MGLPKLCRFTSGFSLLELMMTISIVTLIGTMGTAKFKSYSARAKQAEAKVNLSTLYTLQETFHAENQYYASMQYYGRTGTSTGFVCPTNAIGFAPTPCNSLRYSYYAETDVVSQHYWFQGFARSLSGNQSLVFPGCASDDIWRIDQDRFIVNCVYRYGSSSCNLYGHSGMTLAIQDCR